MVGYNQEKSLINGLILVVISDLGPELIANISPISEEDALVTALHMVSLAGLEDSMNEDDSKIIGPLPVKGTPDYRALYYSHNLKATGATDERLIEHGAKVGVILIFDTAELPKIRRASGLVEPYLKLYISKVGETGELTRKYAQDMYTHIVDIISKPSIRTFYITEEGINEYLDPGYISKKDNIMVLDASSKKMFLLTKKGISPFILRQLRKSVDRANTEFYHGAYQVVRLESFEEIEPLLLKHGIQVR